LDVVLEVAVDPELLMDSGDIASNDLLTSDSIGKSTGIASVLLTLF